MKIAIKIKLNGPVVSGGNSWIYDWLGMETISPKRVINELEKAGGKDVELYINSGGGSVFAAGEIYTALKEYEGKVISKITGVAASAATFFVLASDEVYISPLGQLMIHNASVYTEGDKGDHASNLELLDGVDRSVAKVYQSKTKLSEKEILDLMDKTTWMSAEKAVQLGFADSILFDEEVEVSNSAVLGDELPQEVIDKLKNELLKNALKDGGSATNNSIFGDGSPELITPLDTTHVGVVNQLETQPTNERNDNPMNLEELKAQHPDLYNQVFNLGKEEGKTEGVNNERARIKDIEELAAPGNEAIIAEAKQSGISAMEAFKNIVAADKEKRAAALKNMKQDSEESKAANVVPSAAPQNDQEEDDEKLVQNTANSVVEQMKKLRGVK